LRTATHGGETVAGCVFQSSADSGLFSRGLVILTSSYRSVKIQRRVVEAPRDRRAFTGEIVIASADGALIPGNPVG